MFRICPISWRGEMERSSPPLLLRRWVWVTMGLGAIVTGAVWGVLYAGIPYQDPTEQMQAEWERNNAISGWIMTLGLAVAITGLLLPLIRRILR